MESWLESKKKQLIDAILYAYPSKNDLAMVVSFELRENLEAIAGGDNLTDIVFNLVTRWAIPEGKLEKLFQACYQDKPDNPKLKELEQQYQNQEKLDKLINVLQKYFEPEKAIIFTAYESSLYQVRKLNKTKPQTVEEIINELNMPLQGNYSYLDKFVGYLSLSNTGTSLSNDLTNWGTENIKDFDELIQQLIKEQRQREQQCHPCLMIAISKSGDNYVVEAWLIKNLGQYQRESFSDCEQLKFDNKSEIPTDKNLSNLPKVTINLIQQSLIKANKSIKQIHIFLPSELMNHDFDSWKTEEYEPGEEDFTTGICEDYEVIIRCADRLRGKSPPVFKWRDKANTFKDKLEEYATSVFILGASDNQKTLFDQIKQENVIAVTITSVFEKGDVLGKIIFKSALPLALWTRQQIPDIEEKFKSILKNEENDICLKELPSHVKNKKAQGNNNINHLCLLWDDPDLLPPEQLLTENKL
ncbi:peptidase S1 and S6 chymotrypsin/Hap [Calothrix sp. NIES-2100]|uniref:VMAP-C domain-containing protein n=1 Tax=Calothrix sp. NIES-2100 TaxID=1954172 RepID=UPI000B5F088C|nr:peptidase S1 and S6 chymotrypsin/Hap [Calothrix sp. NIES-2100]